ncbi:hypothetical protein C8039_02220 [Halogeometricum sp. wsp3]|nr:hypothetical protein C8039_02220 [Halogeometricum sp. wsp3]
MRGPESVRCRVRGRSAGVLTPDRGSFFTNYVMRIIGLTTSERQHRRRSFATAERWRLVRPTGSCLVRESGSSCSETFLGDDAPAEEMLVVSGRYRLLGKFNSDVRLLSRPRDCSALAGLSADSSLVRFQCRRWCRVLSGLQFSRYFSSSSSRCLRSARRRLKPVRPVPGRVFRAGTRACSGWKATRLKEGTVRRCATLEHYGSYEKTDDFQYADGSYGILSWWDYGHWITVQGERIPNANPFQKGAPAVALPVAQNETQADNILDSTDAVRADAVHRRRLEDG